ncbi:uncharacterized protein GGS22DRAFT_167183 [Annulohypoxylon maeteangense]|uniref:uncharacterized protein n=1 Tax=Annulohypoxylon maeteangense TaxID=1927788 RepID=UPI00200784DF|nr:uncharacterized protein GGS22DRAFT_167183 [Annulohypoxylon maeteangense]KAI0883513.1 hypothetical protein GGS22DRAFT_167183 [Annulohypoxylon maeteangense]
MTFNTAAKSQIYATCPHSDGKGAPVCWDCSEESWGSLPPFEDFGETKKLRILSGRSQTFAPEVHPPAEGIELGTPNPRYSQPGLEVFTGPQIVTAADKYPNIIEEKIVVTPNSASPTIWGFRRRIFWLIVICVALALLMGVAVGAAVGITQKNNSTKALATTSSSTETSVQVSSTFSSPPEVMTEIVSAITSSLSMSTTNDFMVQSVSSSSKLDTSTTTTRTERSSSSPTSSPTSSLPSSPTTQTSKSVEKVTIISVQTASAPTTSPVQSTPPPTTVTVTPTTKASSQTTTSPTATTSNGDCLGADGSTYTDPGTGARFRIECDIAHLGKDIENYKAQTMEACVSMCASDSTCVGAIWYSAGPQGTDLNYCWLKNTLENTLKSTKDAQSVVRL